MSHLGLCGKGINMSLVGPVGVEEENESGGSAEGIDN